MAYDHVEIEKKARQKWAELDLYTTDLKAEDKEKYYLLVEFPYPSGDLHIGHWYAYSVTDIYARMLRMQGKNVLFPIGFDAFGLPAENAAIKHGLDPRAWTRENIARMREQIATIGASFDWSKEVIACEPSYYQWTQWLFTKLFEHGLAYRKEAAVKWCPQCQTVLANEQITDGHCERCGSEVVEKRLPAWYLRITQYADRLLEGLETLPWREEVKEAQRAWIGRSEGAKIRFQVSGSRDQSDTSHLTPDTCIEVFTTRPDTIFGATYVVLAPEHELVSGLLHTVSNKEQVQAYRAKTEKKTERERSEQKEKTGVKLEGVSALNPATKEELPIFVADYVLASYGTGAVMAVPAHDERDFAFAQEHGLPIREVVQGGDTSREAYTGAGTLVNSGAFAGRSSEEAKGDIVAAVGGERATQYRIRDWSVGRQRYWGCPIPIVYDPEGKPHIIPAEHLPWLLPEDVDFRPTGKAPLASSKELRGRVISIFGEGWTPEYDTLDTFVDSSWYFLRYLDPKNANQFSDQGLLKKWMPVDRYSGGAEHTTMHLLYSRFFNYVLYDLALVPAAEPYRERFNRGVILGPDGAKMSKSRGNVINPDDFVGKYGSDAVRLYLAFIGPYNEPGSYPWSLEGVAAMRKFLERVARLIEHCGSQASTVDAWLPQNVQSAVARAANKIRADGDRFKFNTAVAALMTLLNHLEKQSGVSIDTAKNFIVMLAPFAPHLAEHLWEKLGGEGSVHAQPWPTFDKALLKEERVSVAVQVNGKRRGSITLTTGVTEGEAMKAARGIPAVENALAGSEPRRVVYVPGKILNLVV